jgi:hypothetical protein
MSRGKRDKTFVIFLTIPQAEESGFLDQGFGFVSVSAPGATWSPNSAGYLSQASNSAALIVTMSLGIYYPASNAAYARLASDGKARGILWLSTFCTATSALYPSVFFLLRAHSNERADVANILFRDAQDFQTAQGINHSLRCLYWLCRQEPHLFSSCQGPRLCQWLASAHTACHGRREACWNHLRP